MQSRIITNSLRTIKRSISRFIPLFIMSFLGVFVFAGLESTKPDMLKTLDNYLDNHNIYDLQIVSTLGLTEEDLIALKEIDYIKEVEYSYSVETFIKDNDEDIIINISSLPKNINKITLIEGRLPNNNDEIVVEKNFVEKTNYNINDTILIQNSNLDGEIYKIVGTIDSALYYNNDKLKQERGSTTIGTGTINYYTYVLANNFNNDYYNSIYIIVKDGEKFITSSKEYDNLINEAYLQIESIKEEREQSRYNYLYNEMNKKIVDAETKINKELNKAKNKLNNAKKGLNNVNKELKIGKEKLNAFKLELEIFKATLDERKNEFQSILNKYNINEVEIANNIQKLKEEISVLEGLINNTPKEDNNYIIYIEKYNDLKQNLIKLEDIYKIKEEISNYEYLYNTQIKEYNSLSNNYQKGLSSYNQGLKEYKSGLKDYNIKKEKALLEINEAKEELNSLEVPNWYINNRYDGNTYSDYIDDVTSVDNLSKIFPVVFFAVAILISLISMNRMVEEDRIEIGTLKSLGFSNNSIMIKYLLFSILATLFGGLIGGLLGIYIIPNIIFSIYSMLFNIPNFSVGLNISKILISLILSIVCICGTTIYTILKVVKEKPSELMRPKAPKRGKRIIIEHWKFLWSHLNFSRKVTLRNMLRYKKRGIVTIIGIAGCSALLLCGFGIRDAIIDIAEKEYNEIFKYDALLYVNDIDLNDLNKKNIKNHVDVQILKVKENNVEANLFVIDTDNVSEVVNLIDKDNNKLELEKDKVIITDKFADLNKLSIGDKVHLIDDNNKFYSYEISGITKNYLMHYIYISKDTFENSNNYKENIVYLNFENLSNKEKEDLVNSLMKNDSILNITLTEDLLKSTDDMLKSLNKVVVIIIVLAATLSFVVLYNLSSININERKREISTLKVLGFYDKEVDNYITRENIIFTIIGILIGLFLGYFLTKIVIITVEIEKARFLYQINFLSYIYTTIITITFTLIVNFVMHFTLKKVDMIASLKSVD